jgi:hypothetical protein
MKEPLARPGEVVRKLRGSADEQVAALGADRKKAGRPSPQPSPARGRGRNKKGRRPSRAVVDKAEAALERAEARHKAGAG